MKLLTYAMMEEESASEAIDRDFDHIEDDPDSMELLMGKMEMPIEPYCDITQNYEIVKTRCMSGAPVSLSPYELESKRLKVQNEVINNCDEADVPIKSFKVCPGFATVHLLNNQSVSGHGFVGTGELVKTLSGKDPLGEMKELFVISSYSGEYSFGNMEEIIDDGFLHFIQSLNQLEILATQNCKTGFHPVKGEAYVNGLNTKMMNNNEWKKISEELHDFLTHLRHCSYLLSVAVTNSCLTSMGKIQAFNAHNIKNIDKMSVVDLKRIISRFLSSLYWLKCEVGSMKDLFEADANITTENNIPNAISAFLHVVLTIKFTLISCVHFLQLSLQKIEECVQNLDQVATAQNINDDKKDYVIPRFDSPFFNNAFCRSNGEQQEYEEVFDNYQLSSSNLLKILRLLIKQLAQDLISVTEIRFKHTEKMFDSLRSASSVFGCGCVQEMFFILYHFTNKYCPKQFWNIVSCCAQTQLKKCGNDTGCIQTFYRFFWTLAYHFFPLMPLNERGENVFRSENILNDKYIYAGKVYHKPHMDAEINNSISPIEERFQESKDIILLYLRGTLKVLDEKFSEQNLRVLLFAFIQMTKLSRKSAKKFNEISTANVVALSLLWDFFIKRLNNHFKAPVPSFAGVEAKKNPTLTEFTLLAPSHTSWISYVRETILSKHDENRYNDKSEQGNLVPIAGNLNCYYVFVYLVAEQLDPCLNVSKEPDIKSVLFNLKSSKALKQFVGRIRSKLPASKVQSLEEVGLHYLFTLFISLMLSQQGDECDNLAGIVSVAEAVISLAKEEIKPTQSLAPRKLVTYLRGLISVLVLLLQTLQNQVSKFKYENTSDEIVKERKKLANLLKSFFDVLSQRIELAIDATSHQSMNLNKLSFSTSDNAIKVYADLLQDPVCLASSSLFLCQEKLIHAGIGKYLQQKQKSATGAPEIKNVLVSLIAVTTRIRRYYQQIERKGFMSLSIEERGIKEGIDETCFNLWKNVYPVIKSSLCTFSSGNNLGFTSAIATQVAEFIITMTLLSKSLASSSWTPNTYNNSPIESFSEMFKYYSQSPVVHPAVGSAFLLNVVQNNNRGFELDSTQVLLLLKGWVRCSSLLLPGDETLTQLSQYILPLCKELSHSYNPNVENYDGIGVFLIAVSKLYIRTNFCESVRKRYEPILESYIDCVNRHFQQVVSSGSQVALSRLYMVGSLIVKHCARQLYVEKLVNRLQPILQRLLTSPTMLKEDFNMTNDMKYSVSRSIPDFIRGICTLQHLQSDQFAIRTLKSIYVTYLHRFEINEGHPFILSFKKPIEHTIATGSGCGDEFPMSCFVNFSEMYVQFFKTVRNEFLSKQPSQKHRLTLKHTLEFVLISIKVIPELSYFAVQTIFGALLDIKITLSSDETGVKNIAAELITLLVKEGQSDGLIDKNESVLLNAILRELEQYIKSYLGFYVDETFQLLTALSTLNKKLIRNLMPNIEATVQEIEVKRGIQASGNGMFQKRLNELKRRIEI